MKWVLVVHLNPPWNANMQIMSMKYLIIVCLIPRTKCIWLWCLLERSTDCIHMQQMCLQILAAWYKWYLFFWKMYLPRQGLYLLTTLTNIVSKSFPLPEYVHIFFISPITWSQPIFLSWVRILPLPCLSLTIFESSLCYWSCSFRFWIAELYII